MSSLTQEPIEGKKSEGPTATEQATWALAIAALKDVEARAGSAQKLIGAGEAGDARAHVREAHRLIVIVLNEYNRQDKAMKTTGAEL